MNLVLHGWEPMMVRIARLFSRHDVLLNNLIQEGTCVPLTVPKVFVGNPTS